MKKLLLVLLLATSCSNLTSPRADMRLYTSLKPAEDLVFETIELHEVEHYAWEFNNTLKHKGIKYSVDVFDCEDYVRGLIAHIMLRHKYTRTPAVGQCKVLRPAGWHMVLIFVDKRGTVRFYDVQGRYEVKVLPNSVKYVRF